MTPIDPKLIALARSLRPDLAQRLIVMKATEAGRGILIKPAGGAPMPARPPLPSTPDPTAAKAAVLARPAPGLASGPQSVALSAYVDEGARALEAGQGSAIPGPVAPAEAERPGSGAAPQEVPGRGVPYATAHLPPGRPVDEAHGAEAQRGTGGGRQRPAAGRGGSDAARVGAIGRAGLLALAAAVLLALLAAAFV